MKIRNESQIRDTNRAAGLRLKTRVKAGGLPGNHNEALISDSNRN